MSRLILFCIVPVVVFAQDPDSVRSTSRLSVGSIPEGAEVMVDSVMVGETPLKDLTLPAGIHRLAIAYPSFRDWNTFVRRQTLRLLPGEEMTTSAEFGSVLNLHSVPSGADVVYEGKSLGTTPLFYRSPATLRTALRLRKDGYEEATVDPSSGRLVVPLRLRGDSIPPSDVLVQSMSDRIQPRWVTYVSAAGVVISGVAAAYFKRQADNRFEEYAATGRGTDLDATRRYDTYSGIALVATQISFATLAYFLLSE